MNAVKENGNASALRAPGNPASGPSDVQHTPGPWTVHDNGHFLQIDTEAHGCIASVCDSKFIYINGVMMPEAEANLIADANARLIAAAPCLLEALQGLLSCRPSECHTHWAKARAAIARATKSEVQS